MACRLTRMAWLAAALSASSAPLSAAEPPPVDLLDEIQNHFHAARKWFEMVADLEYEHASNGTLTPRFERLRSRFVLARDPANQMLAARLPYAASGPHEVWIDGEGGLSVRTEEIGMRAVPAEVLRGMVIYRNAVAGGDLLYKLTPTHVDEYIYFREPPAHLRREFEFDTGRDVAKLRSAGRLIEVVGKDGWAHLRLSAPLARAVDGTRRTGVVRIEGTRIVEEIDLSGLAAPILVDPDWTTTGSMTVAHWADFAWRRPDNAVMAVGGCALASCPLGLGSSACSQVLASTDVWDPNAGVWTAGAPMQTQRYSYAGVALDGGDLLVAGGCTATGCGSTTALAERYSNTQATWSAAGSLTHAVGNASGAPLQGGDAIVVGGCSATTCFADGQRYRSAGNSWTSIAPLGGPRAYATATPLPDGTVLFVGGCGDPACATVLGDAERYDPASNTFRSAGSMSAPRAGHAATLLTDGTVLVTGGCTAASCQGSTLSTSEVWRSDASHGDTFSSGPALNAPRHHHTATLLATGEVLIAGGTDGMDATNAASEVFLPVSDRFINAPRMMMSRAYHVSALLASGDVLVAGGCNPATCLPWAEVFSPDGLPIEIPDGGVADIGFEPDLSPMGPPDFGAPRPTPGGPHPKLYRTGAVSCSTDDAQDLACPIAGWPAQDGDYQPNVRPFVPSGNGEVSDPTSGLIWQAQDDGKLYTNQQAIEACAALQAAGDGGGTWRLPSVVELMTINDYGKNGPSIDQAFQNTQQTNYWTSSPVATSTMLAWTVKFDAGEVVPLLKDTALPIRCVRGELQVARPSADHLRLAGPLSADGNTVRDDANILEWQRHDDGVKRSWRESLEYCSNLTLDGHDDWHLPNIYELLSIVEFGSKDPVKIDSLFEAPKGDLYWSSTFNEGIPTLSWAITFNLGVVDGVTVSGKGFARCVRHIQPTQDGGCSCSVGHAGSSHDLDGALRDSAVLFVLLLVARLRRRFILLRYARS